MPPVPLARLRVEGNLLEIEAQDLVLSADEAGKMFDGLGASIDRELIEDLVRRTEGWAAGLQLARLAMSRTDDVASLVHSFGGRDRLVADYLTTEVLNSLPDDERRFMIETAVLRQLSPELCDAITGRTDSAAHLASLERSNAFVIPLDRAGIWYRYHHLFADLLTAQSLPDGSPTVQERHRRAMVWLGDRGHMVEAVHHGLASGRRIEAADLVCANWWELNNRGQVETARKLIELFDADEIRGYQPLAIAAAFIYAACGEDAHARQFLEAAEEGTFEGAPPDGAATIESSLALVSSSLAFDGVERALIDGSVAYDLEPPDSAWRPLAALIVGLALVMKDDYEAAAPYFEEASQVPDDSVRAYALAELSLGQLAAGQAERAVAIAEEATQAVIRGGLDELITAASAYTAQAHAYFALGNTAQARTSLDAAKRPLDYMGQAMPMDALRVQVLLADVALELGDHDTARTCLNRSAQLAATVADTGRLDAKLTALQTRWKSLAPQPIEHEVEPSPFTKREVEVLNLLSRGLSTREIGEELFLSRNTIKSYLRRVYRKLNATSRSEAVARAKDMGLLARSS
ncbi:MAG: LuxR C-terminal-related transcriptional regulator, partial [Acidimicrobiales bacterium]